jgi:hypothetical protein
MVDNPYAHSQINKASRTIITAGGVTNSGAIFLAEEDLDDSISFLQEKITVKESNTSVIAAQESFEFTAALEEKMSAEATSSVSSP